MNNKPITECIRCGKCCEKGGPSLHTEDLSLVESGVVLLRDLYTIRQGETAFDNVRGNLFPVTSDIVKIKSKKGSRACVFMDRKDKKSVCAIYQNRPLECRVLKCWDTREIEQVYNTDRITRKEIFGRTEGLWELVKSHQIQCAGERIERLARQIKLGNEDAHERIREIISYDSHIRSLVSEKGKLDPEICDFLFGRPMKQIVKAFEIGDL